MIKKLLTVFLCICMVFVHTGAFAGEMAASFTLNPIKKNTDAKRLVVSVTIPSAVSGGTLFIAFYKDGVFTQLTELGATSSVKFSKTIKYTYTPDDIRLFMWEKGRLRPLSSSRSCLTEEVIEHANTEVEALLSMVEDTTDSIREMLMPDVRPEDVEIMEILAAIDECAVAAINADYGREYLLTSEFCAEMFEAELKRVQSMYTSASSNAKDRLENLYLNYLDDEYADVITDFLGFFDIKVL